MIDYLNCVEPGCTVRAEINRVRCAKHLTRNREKNARHRARNGQVAGAAGRPRKADATPKSVEARKYYEPKRAVVDAPIASGLKITSETLKLVNSLPADQRAKVDAMIRRHVQACVRNGFLPENLERAYIEAVELVELEERFPEAEATSEFRPLGT